VLSSIDTGNGVDDFDYVPATHTAYVGAARDAKLTIALDDAKGHLTLVASVPTAAGARNPAVAKNGAVYLAHGGGTASNDLVVCYAAGSLRDPRPAFAHHLVGVQAPSPVRS